jgi:hypothetical protein
LRVKRAAVALAVLLAAGLFFTWPELVAMIYGARPQNRYKVYAIRQAVNPGMAAARVVEAVEQAGRPLIVVGMTPDRILVKAPVGYLDSVYLEIDLREGRVVHARVRDHEGRLLADAPRDF